MDESPISIDKLISEISASLTYSSGEAAVRRINAERLLHLVLEELVETQVTEGIRVLADKTLAGDAAADILLQIDEYDLRLELLDTPDGNPSLDIQQLSKFRKTLQTNPNTVALILVWTSDDLDAVALTIARIQYLLQNPHRLADLLAQAKPLVQVLQDILERQVKIWDARLDPGARGASAQTRDLRRQFTQALEQAIELEIGRTYRSKERMQAAQRFRAEEETRVILNALETVMIGTPIEKVVSQLTRLAQ
ncbi:MAG: hypothetical protein M5U01_09215 [Ardenticatenaceae bacterium]|nr:hypothetical protein [Ardenticatenaceae bacterium]HBY94183.1 hypothetical protein [Chloroflexota bacterium]